METIELILLIAGIILFLFSLGLIIFLVKRNSSYKGAILLVAISLVMMGFSTIIKAKIAGVLEFEKEQKLSAIEIYTKALEDCPENKELSENLDESVKSYEETETADVAEENTILGYAYYALGNEEKAIENSNQALSKDSTNAQAKSIIDLINTQNLIKDWSIKGNKLEVSKTLEIKMDSLNANPNISNYHKENMQRFYFNKRDSLRLNQIRD